MAVMKKNAKGAAPKASAMGVKPQGRAKVIDALNKARSMELYAITQYMNQHYHLDDADYGALAKEVKRIAIDEMRHAEDLAERIMDLGGEPTTQHDGILAKGQEVNELFPFNTAVEDDTIEKYNQFVQLCRDCGDQVSANLFERLIEEEQEHRDYFDDQATHIEKLGNHYLARIAASGDSE